jgi:Cof subfamily protein (haloacid dehalogenase superfamily)
MIRKTDGETLLHLKLDMDVALHLLSIFRKRQMYVQSYIDDELYVKSTDDKDFKEYAKHFGAQGHPIGDGLYTPSAAPTKLLAMTDSLSASYAMIKEFTGIFGDRLYVTSSNENFVEMMNSQASKGKCLEKLSEALGIGMENVLAIGDGENDVEMIKRAGTGIAMGNARASVKIAASDTAPSNDECGVAWAVEKYILNGA